MEDHQTLHRIREMIVTEVEEAFAVQTNPRSPYSVESWVDLLLKVLHHRLCDSELDAVGRQVIEGFQIYSEKRDLLQLATRTEPFAKFVFQLIDPDRYRAETLKLRYESGSPAKLSFARVLKNLEMADNRIIKAAQEASTLGELEKYGAFARQIGTTYYLRNLEGHKAPKMSEKQKGAYFECLCVFFVYLVAQYQEPIQTALDPVPAFEKRYDRQKNRLIQLDEHQRNMVYELIGGHRIIKGPSGTGKTTVLVYKALCLLRDIPGIKTILFLSYNITLANYIKRLLAQHKAPLGPKGIEVYPFYEFCGRVLKRPVAHEGRSKEYYRRILADTLSTAKEIGPNYDAILVDEVQDFSDEMLRVVVSQLNPKTNSLTLALDENQNIYNRRRSWKRLNINAYHRVHWLTRVYRPTAELYRFTAGFIDSSEIEPSGSDRQRSLFADDLDASHGPVPEMQRFDSLEDIIQYIADTIHRCIKESGYPRFEFAVLYTSARFGQAAIKELPEMIRDGLARHGILANWISKDYRAKNAYDVTTQSVTISSIHSVKGFDYSCVFLVGMDVLDEQRWSKEEAVRLGYVAITRVRDELYIPYIKEGQLVRRLKDGLPDNTITKSSPSTE